MVTIEEARSRILAEAQPLPEEDCSLDRAVGRALAQDVVAPHDTPPFSNSAMDGYAVRSADTKGAGPDDPIELSVVETIAAGEASEREIGPGEAAKIMTGAPLPPGADAVIEVEATNPKDSKVEILREVSPESHIRLAGEDVKQGETVLFKGDALGPPEIGVLASLGFPSVPVHRLPRVAVLATGSELVPVDQPLRPGQIRDSNSYTAAAQCRALGIEPVRLETAPDDYEATRRLIEEGLSYDVLVTSGGVSVGEFDFVKDVQDELGVERRLWKVAMKPGRPLSFGVRDGTLVFGVPGNPVAAMVSFELFVRPALLRMMGYRRILRPMYRAVLQEGAPNRYGRVHVMRVRAWWEDGCWKASSVGPQGSGIIQSMVRANGLVLVPADAAGLQPGDTADLMLFRDELFEEHS